MLWTRPLFGLKKAGKNMFNRNLLLLFALAAIWGSSFMFMRSAVPEFGPVPLTASRCLLAAVVLLPFLLQGKHRHLLRRHWPALLAIGPISTAVPFSLLAFSTGYTSAGFTAILNALTPICSALIGLFWIGEVLSMQAIIGVLLGFTGVSVMVLDRETISSSLPLIPVLAAMLATFFYGLTAHFSRRYLREVPATLIAAACQASATLFLLPFAWWYWPETAISVSGWLQVGALGILCTTVAFLMYFHLLAQLGVARTVIVTYLIPVFAMVWGRIFLDEVVTLPMLLGATLILTGIGLTTMNKKEVRRGT